MVLVAAAMRSSKRWMDNPLPILLLLILFLFRTFPSSADLSADGAALIAFRNAVGRFVLPWNGSISPCQWPGVACEANRVTSLRLPAAGLMGQIPAFTLGNLSELQTLSLRVNALSGPLPSDLSRCAHLRNIYLQRNRFFGEIPPFLPSLTALVRLNLADNGFSGSIPLAFNNLTRLATLYLERNQLTGEIPDLDLPNLTLFNVSYNRLNGSVPAKLRGMPADAFLGMPMCGGALGTCPGVVSPAPAGIGTSSSGGSSKLSGGAIAGIAIGAAVLLLILAIVLFLLCRRKGKSGALKPLESEVARPAKLDASVADKRMVDGVGTNGYAAPAGSVSNNQLIFFGNATKNYDLGDLLRASAEVLGKGTFGTSYKAVLETGMVVAVKRLRDVNLPEMNFREKIEAIGAMDHPNVVALRAYYHSKDEKLLVYDYMPMGSLSSLLHGSQGTGRTPLDWETRISFALAAARGLEYIHSTSPTASHGNIKSSNILLASSTDARISDHCLTHLVGASSSSMLLSGYQAPEVTSTSRVSQKGDVYSFGVLLLELLTGKAPAQAHLNDEGVDLPRWVQSVVREEWTAEVFDMELLRYQSVEEEMVQMLQLGVNCTTLYPEQRPTMTEVVETIGEVQRSSSATRKGQQLPQQELGDAV